VVSRFQELLGAPTVLMGFAPPDARIHAPNEHFPLGTFFKAIATCGHFLGVVGRDVTRARKGTTDDRRLSLSRRPG
jgi:acetylornithine deacetylase/succinyl-diaminopimelate desuccinylase-like protein